MTRYITEEQQIPVMDFSDVIVAGGGIAGIAAALSAARHGLRVLLMEKSAILGGLATLGLINWYEPLCDGDGQQMTTGIAEELLKLSIAYGYDNLPDRWGGSGNKRTHDQGRYATAFNPSVFALALNELLLRETITFQYDLLAARPVMEGSRCKGIIAESKSGRAFFPARVVIDAAASGRTPYCIGALEYAKSLGAGRISISCNPGSVLSKHADIGIEADTGAEVVMGSTRLKAASAQKMIMNMLSTAVVIRLGRTYDNLMVHISARNQKADNRMLRLFSEAVGNHDPAFAQKTLAQAQGDLALAVFMALSDYSPQKARKVLENHGGDINVALSFCDKAKADVYGAVQRESVQ